MSYRENITRIKAVYNALGDLAEQVVFVGGATVALYASRVSGEVRPTNDVDIIVEVITLSDYKLIEEKLRAQGFENDMESGVLCRYIIDGVIVDVMPTKENIIGTSNKWYEEGFDKAIIHHIDELHTVKIFSVPYFLAAKIEAFKDRGKNDGRMSRDFEDIVFVLNNRSTVQTDIEKAPHSVRSYLKEEWRILLNNNSLPEWIGAHLDYSEQTSVDVIMSMLREIVNKS